MHRMETGKKLFETEILQGKQDAVGHIDVLMPPIEFGSNFEDISIKLSLLAEEAVTDGFTVHVYHRNPKAQ